MTAAELDAFRARLGEVLAWLAHERLASDVGERTAKRLAVNDVFAADRPREAFEEVARRRLHLLSEANVSVLLPLTMPPGRVLLLYVDYNLKDGASRVFGGGYFSDYNVPVCDFWIHYFESVPAEDGTRQPALASWVPQELLPLVERGMAVNPEECFAWADEVLPELPAVFASETGAGAGARG